MIEEVEKILGYQFKNKGLLRKALTHSSYTSRVEDNYERLEFLGDRVLGLAIASLLYTTFPNEPEGSLSQRHTGLVCGNTVAHVAQKLGLDKYVVAATAEMKENESVLSDVGEAVLGAIYVDAGCEKAVNFVQEHWKDLIDKKMCPPKDAKTSLQEIAHIKGFGAPHYEEIGKEGSEHEPIFHIAVHVEGIGQETGQGRNKKLAEQAAAAKMLLKIETNHE